jgi:hypothetical protein
VEEEKMPGKFGKLFLFSRFPVFQKRKINTETKKSAARCAGDDFYA